MCLPITTGRLIIRPFTAADFEAIHAVWDGAFSHLGHRWDFYTAIRRQATAGHRPAPAPRSVSDTGRR